jgi:hypothetical protein
MGYVSGRDAARNRSSHVAAWCSKVRHKGLNNKGACNNMQRTFAVKLTGVTDLLMHKDNIDWSERTQKWQKDPANKKFSVAGDDRSPGWTWIGCLYQNRGVVVMDSDNIMAMLREGGKQCPKPKGKGNMQKETQSGIVCNEIGWPVLIKGKKISTESIMGLKNEIDFEKHIHAAEALGFELFVKRARIEKKKHVRVRPRFSNWSMSGTLTVVDDQISENILKDILKFGGAYSGLGDWRPAGYPLKPGPFGRFEAEVEMI